VTDRRFNLGWILVRFFAAFAFTMAVWHATPLPAWYEQAELTVAGIVGPAIHGWMLEPPADGRPRWRWHRGPYSVDQVLELQQVASGLVPLVALIWALPQVPFAKRLGKTGAAVIIHFLLLAVVATAFPVLVFYQNPLTDIAGTWLGFVTFVAAPALLWWVVCWNELTVLLPAFRLEPRQKPSRKVQR